MSSLRGETGESHVFTVLRFLRAPYDEPFLKWLLSWLHGKSRKKTKSKLCIKDTYFKNMHCMQVRLDSKFFFQVDSCYSLAWYIWPMDRFIHSRSGDDVIFMYYFLYSKIIYFDKFIKIHKHLKHKTRLIRYTIKYILIVNLFDTWMLLNIHFL